jgi:hypothetical protein
MDLCELIESIRLHRPHLPDAHVARLAFILVRDPDLRLADVEASIESLQLRLTMLDDRQSAVTEEIDELASTQPCEFSPDHVWTLIRAIKVQSQILEHYEIQSTVDAV